MPNGNGCVSGFLLMIAVVAAMIGAAMRPIPERSIVWIVCVVSVGLVIAVEAAHRVLLRQAKEANARAKEQYWQMLSHRFGEEAAGRIWLQQIWVGAPFEAVVEMFGAPAEVKHNVRGERVRQNYRFFQTAANRFALKVDVENGFVTGWDM